jgi:DNA (cytosine-5)-methyltransferase 1
MQDLGYSLLQTPTVDDAKNTGHNQNRRISLASQVWKAKQEEDWEEFQPALTRWEEITGRKAPEPTRPDGKDGEHRVSPEFVEWMMGLEEGHITGRGLSRRSELSIAGNGVVPQQAELALRILLGEKK